MTQQPIYFLLTFCLLLVLFSCGQNQEAQQDEKTIDPMQAALPHGDTLPENDLSAADRMKLSNAAGRRADTLGIDELITLIDSSSNILHAYVFWKLDCPACMEQYQLINRLQQEVGQASLNVIMVNLDPLQDMDKVNTSIRLKGIPHEVYALSNLDISSLSGKYSNLFSSKLPTILFVNKTYDTFIFYDKTFEYEELFAMTQPLLM